MKKKILEIDLSNHAYKWSKTSEEDSTLYLGGAGLNALTLFRRTYKGQSPEDPAMPVIFGVGTLSGKAVFANRVTVTTKSPLTGYYLDSNAGGRFSLMMARNQIDQIIINGRSNKPIYLYITDEKVEFLDASMIWDMGVFSAYKYFINEYGKQISAGIIGIAGSSGVRFANLVFDCDHHAGRGGIGYSLGIKNLKALVIDSPLPPVKMPHQVQKINKKLINIFNQHPDIQSFKKVHPFEIIEKNINRGLISVKNWQTNTISPVQNETLFNVDEAFKKVRSRDVCPLCPLPCRLKFIISKGKFANEIVNGLEVSTLSNLGINLNIFDLPTLGHFHILASDYGLDTTELGVVIGLAIEASQQGKSIGNFPPASLKWGEPEIVEMLIHQIAKGEGVGKILGQGVSRFMRDNTDLRKFTIKDLSVPSSGSIPSPDWTLGDVVSVRGGDHLRHFTFLTRSAQVSEQARKYSEIVLGTQPVSMDKNESQGRFVWFHENYTAVLDTLGLCIFPFILLSNIPYLGILAGLYKAVYGRQCTANDLFWIGERIVQAQRAFNFREGINRDDQTISAPLANRIGQMLAQPGMIDEYYYFRGLQPNGELSPNRLQTLNLDFLVKALNIDERKFPAKEIYDLSQLPDLDEEKMSF